MMQVQPDEGPDALIPLNVVPKQPRLFENTLVREFRGPFAHMRARHAFNFLVEWGTWQAVGWERFSWREPRTWWYARVEAVNTLSRRDWNRIKNYTRDALGERWDLHKDNW